MVQKDLKEEKYDGTQLAELDAPYKCILGARDNGKSYWVKNYIMKKAYEEPDGMFVLVRRWTDEVKPVKVERFFTDCKIEKITKGRFNAVQCYRGELFLVKKIGDTYAEEKMMVGCVVPLVMEEKYKGQPFDGYKYIIFEEFITKKYYLPDETTYLESLISSVAREKENIQIWLIGNTYRRNSPYFYAWGLEGILRQQIGTIAMYELDGVKFAVDKTDKVSTQQSKLFWGKQKKNIIEGEWESRLMPHLEGERKDYQLIYEMILSHQGLKYLIEMLINKPDSNIPDRIPYPTIYVSFYEGERIFKRIIQEEYDPSILVTKRFQPERFVPEKFIVQAIKDTKVVYSDDLTGTEFEDIINSYI